MPWYNTNTNTQPKKTVEPEQSVRSMMAAPGMEANPESEIKEAEKEEEPKKAKSKSKKKEEK